MRRRRPDTDLAGHDDLGKPLIDLVSTTARSRRSLATASSERYAPRSSIGAARSSGEQYRRWLLGPVLGAFTSEHGRLAD